MAQPSARAQKARAAAWFAALRDRICAAFEALEDAQDAGPFAGAARRPLRAHARPAAPAPDGEDAGGGVMAVMREGRVFEKVGVNVSTVHGALGAEAQRSLTARTRDPRPRRRPAASGPRASASSRTCARR